ncbi:hypothetical protein EDB92DRAFT_232552 [Lactarius akahatsu]|uniref:Secreted protein n=1 Tax=Lactarius akahatsu TaxID=416441 RepID=A0AAD4LIX6_9AGAM|nr:hypothetical protein EDB92DRAFT_232552 [Lactarius akahatsu]
MILYILILLCMIIDYHSDSVHPPVRTNASFSRTPIETATAAHRHAQMVGPVGCVCTVERTDAGVLQLAGSCPISRQTTSQLSGHPTERGFISRRSYHKLLSLPV